MSKRGLTLIEVLAVIGIVAILMAILGMALGLGIAKSRTRPGCSSNLRQIATAYVLYQGDHDGGLPQNGGMVSNPYVGQPYHLSTKCPLNGKSYWDNYVNGMLSLREPKGAGSSRFPDGRPIPLFDPTLDVLARCLEHSADGFSRGHGNIWVIDRENTKGRILGVRLDGSVRLVSPLSCWEARSRSTGMLQDLSDVWHGCDRASQPREEP